MSEQMGGEELDSLVDIFAGIMFMIFCAFAIAYMVVVMSGISRY